MTERRFTLLVHSNDPSDATSFYRAIGPLAALKRQCDWLAIQQAPAGMTKANWAAVAGVDGVFLQRPSTLAAEQLAARAHLQGLPVWIDYDDALGHLPADNPCAEEYGKKVVRQHMKRCLELADVITVSTPMLRNLVEEETEKEVRVIPNALMDFFVGPMKERRDQKPIIAWRGSDTHQRDLMTYAADIVAAAKALDRFSWFFLGWNPWFITEHIDRDTWRQEPLTGVVEYFHRLRELAPSTVIAPLHDSVFNRAKSNIAWLEATWAGAVVVANDLPEWLRPGVFVVEKPGTFADGIISATLSNSAANEAWQTSRDYIEKNLLIDHVNAARATVIETMRILRGDPAWVTKTMRSIPLIFGA